MIPRPVNPFVLGDMLAAAPRLDPSLMNPTLLAQQNAPLAGGLLSGAPRMSPGAPPPSIQPMQAPQMADGNAGALAAMLGGGRGGLGGDAGLAFAAGVLGGGPTNQALARGFGNVLATKGATPTDAIREYQFAQANPQFVDFLQKRGGAGAFGLTPVPYVKDDGTIGYGVTSRGGMFKPLDVPSGSLIDPFALAGGKAAAEAAGKVAGGAQANLGGAAIQANQTIGYVDQLLSNSGLDEIVGPIDSRRPDWALSDNGRDALARFSQLRGTAFLEAYQTLKGGGQITEIEGAKAESALARMDRSQSAASFRQALMDFKDAIKTGLAKMQAQAGATATYGGDVVAPAIAPAAGTGGAIDYREYFKQ